MQRRCSTVALSMCAINICHDSFIYICHASCIMHIHLRHDSLTYSQRTISTYDLKRDGAPAPIYVYVPLLIHLNVLWLTPTHDSSLIYHSCIHVPWLIHTPWMSSCIHVPWLFQTPTMSSCIRVPWHHTPSMSSCKHVSWLIHTPWMRFSCIHVPCLIYIPWMTFPCILVSWLIHIPWMNTVDEFFTYTCAMNDAWVVKCRSES